MFGIRRSSRERGLGRFRGRSVQVFVRECIGSGYPTCDGVQQCEEWFELEQFNEDLCQDGCWIGAKLAGGSPNGGRVCSGTGEQ